MTKSDMKIRNVVLKLVDRLSDYINDRNTDFVIVFDGTSELDRNHTTVFFVNKRHIVKVSPGNPGCVHLN